MATTIKNIAKPLIKVSPERNLVNILPKIKPNIMPGINRPNISQTINFCLLYANAEDADVKITAASDVAVAIDIVIFAGNKCKFLKITIKVGTIIIPPPIPKNPDNSPVNIPEIMYKI